jgi:putative intracellular protease/amidase
VSKKQRGIDIPVALSILMRVLAPVVLVVLSGCAGMELRVTSRAAEEAPKRVAIVLTNHGQLGATGRSTGFFLSEATHPHQVFMRAGYTVDFLSPKGGFAPMDGVDTSDPINAAFLSDPTLVARTTRTRPISEVNSNHYDAVFFAGGHGTMWDFPDNSGVQALTREVYERGGVVAAVCHGPAALVNVRLTTGAYLAQGKEISSFTNEEEMAVNLANVVPFALETRLRERGASFQKAPNFEKMVAVSGRLVTGQNPASASGVAEAMVELLEAAPPLPQR